MVIGSYEVANKDINIRLNLFQLLEINPTNPKVKYLDLKVIPIENNKNLEEKEYIQALDLSLKKDGDMCLSMFLRQSCEVHIFRIKDNKF